MKRFKHSLTNYHLLSTRLSRLTPVACYEVLPGDTIQAHSSMLIRVSPQLAPVMHPVQVRIHHWFVPHRLVWPGWEDFITGVDDTPPPTFTDNVTNANLPSYLGINPQNISAGNSVTFNALSLNAYNLIYNEFYRDQDLQSERSLNDTTLARVAWGKDYFTTARPWPQKGGDITVPLQGFAPVRFFDSVVNHDTSLALGAGNALTGNGNNSNIRQAPGTPFALWTDNDSTVSDAHVAIDDLREAFALQRFEEARARYGSRYTEYLRYLGVVPADSRLQRPEFLGGGRQMLSFSEVLQTAEGTDPVGQMRGHGISAMRSGRFRKFIPEHGYVMSLMSVIPKPVYMQGMRRDFFKSTKEDYWQRELEHIGQQEIFNGELYFQNTAADNDVFGYQDRYAEYRYNPSQVSGQFRDTLNYWHFARDFSALPVLNASFVECNPTDRVFADQTGNAQHLWCMVHNKIVARRMVTKNTGSYVK